VSPPSEEFWYFFMTLRILAKCGYRYREKVSVWNEDRDGEDTAATSTINHQLSSLIALSHCRP
jgi:hypothetical protein